MFFREELHKEEQVQFFELALILEETKEAQKQKTHPSYMHSIKSILPMSQSGNTFIRKQKHNAF